MKNIYFHKPPHSIFLISGDRDFSKTLNFLESVNYSVTLIHSNKISDVLRYSVRDTILWSSLIKDGVIAASTHSPPPFTSSLAQSPDPVVNSTSTMKSLDSSAKSLPSSSSLSLASTKSKSIAQVSDSANSSQAIKRSSTTATIDDTFATLYPKSPERALMILREIKSLGSTVDGSSSSSRPASAISKSPKIYLSEVPVQYFDACGFKSGVEFANWAHNLKYITYDRDRKTVMLESAGISIVQRFKGCHAPSVLARAPILERTKQEFFLAVNCMFEINEKGTAVRKQDFMKGLHLKISIAKTFGYRSANAYYAAAVTGGVISEDRGNDTVSLRLMRFDSNVKRSSVSSISSSSLSSYYELQKPVKKQRSEMLPSSRLTPLLDTFELPYEKRRASGDSGTDSNKSDSISSIKRIDSVDTNSSIACDDLIIRANFCNDSEKISSTPPNSEISLNLAIVKEEDFGSVAQQIEFIWPYGGGKKVVLMGSWNGWTEETAMENNDNNGNFRAVISLDKGQTYEYTFVVDGNWTVDTQRPVVHRNVFVNNVLKV
ncbi:hypothetical protein HK100_006447 [Physocladia obscura]|uniref:AMP-activated protein kinase glycogen-binding domain-containing protein n=1 Tax=Physocladia obscura TaxID=109957 RepID=A0AAD5SRE9_9FUNG|nr:hypothetical protein HK100_006447 [Physocladia obscura]